MSAKYPVALSPSFGPHPNLPPNLRTTDNYNQLILIDDIAGYLISCGSVFQGTCTARLLEDISFAIPDSESFYPENYVVATDHR